MVMAIIQIEQLTVTEKIQFIKSLTKAAT